MQPTIQPGNLILVDTWAYQNAAPIENDIVTFTLPDRPEYVMVKRIARSEHLNTGYIMLGDNPKESEDSRFFGAVAGSLVNGKVVRVIGGAAR